MEVLLTLSVGGHEIDTAEIRPCSAKDREWGTRMKLYHSSECRIHFSSDEEYNGTDEEE